MNTIQIQINDKQYDNLQYLLGIAKKEFSHQQQDDMLSDLEEALASTKSYLWMDSYGYIELDIAAEHVDALAVPGDNEPACIAAIENDGYLRRQLEEMDMEAAVNYLYETGIENAADKSNDDLKLYILWMACHDIDEERNMEE